MSMEIVYGDITCCSCDAIVNAANGIGFMGGIIGRIWKCGGVAETIHYNTKGRVEWEARLKCLRRFPVGYLPGSVYSTGAYSLPCKHVIHAVTMYLPGTFSRMSTVKKLLTKIIEEAGRLNARTIALPLLGAGTGRLKPDRVMQLYHDAFDALEGLHVQVYIYRKEEN